MILFTATIQGQLYSKSNRRKVVKFGKRPALIKSDEARNWETTAILQINASGKPSEPITCDVVMTAHIYYINPKADLDDTLLCDALEHAGVIKNDNQIREKHLYSGISKKDPRVVVMLEEMEQPCP